MKLQFFGEIGYFPASAEHVAEQLRLVKPDELIEIEINSGGGDAFAGENIRAMLASSSQRVRVTVMGQAASAATTIMLAGDEVRMTANSVVMIHKASVGTYGSAREIRSKLQLLDAVDASLVKMWAKRMNVSEERAEELLDAETWFTPDEALSAGIVNEILPALDIAASASARAVPERLRTVLASSAKTVHNHTMTPALLQLLGLKADAKPEEIDAAVAAHQAQQQSAVEAAVAENEAKHQAVAAAAAATQVQAEDFEAQVAAAVDAQIADGKILPAGRQAALAACGKTKVTLDACVNFWRSAPRVHTPVAIVTQSASAARPGEVDASDKAAVAAAVKALSPLQLRMCRESGISPEQFVTAKVKVR